MPGTEVGSGYVSLIPSLRGFGSALDRGIGPSVEKSGRTHGRVFGNAFVKQSVGPLRLFAGLAAGAFAAIKTVDVLKGFVSDARESVKVGALTNQVIKSTGQVAGVSAKQVGSLATALSQKTGIDDEAIQSSENLLLTFTNVRDQIGKGNAVFTRATGLIQDMGVALGQDGKTGAIQLGKALNDPVKGVTALARVGVSFTQQQKDQIKTFVESGNILKAQKVILGELSKEFGGAAAAAATPAQKLAVTFGNIKESIGTGLLPLIDSGASKLNHFFTEMVNGEGAGGKLKATLSGIGGAIKDAFSNALPGLQEFGRTLFVGVKGALEAILPTLKAFGGFLTGSLLPALSAEFAEVLPRVKAAFTSIGDTISNNRGVFIGLGHVLTQVLIPAVAKVAGIVVDLLGPAFKLIVATLKFVVIPAFVVLATGIVTSLNIIVKGAALAFGWIPGLGPKLKSASADFDRFADKTNAALQGILTDVFVTVHVNSVVEETPLHNKGFIGPTMAEGKEAAGILGPFTDADKGVISDQQRAIGERRAKAAQSVGQQISTALADGVTKDAPKVAKAATETVNKAMEAAKTALKDAKQQLADYAKSVRESISSFGDLTGIGSTGAAATPNSLKNFLTRQLTAITTFQQNLKALAKRGISDSLLKRIADAGVEAGGPVAAALVRADKDQFADITRLDAQVNKRAGSIGTLAANRVLGDEVKDARRAIGTVNVTINNPLPERASTTAPKAVRRALLAVR